MTITLYTNASEQNRLTKELKQLGAVTAVFKDATDLLNPTLVLSSVSAETAAACNYVYIPEVKRYYFVTDIQSVRNGVWQLACHVDVLQTYADGIKAQEAIIHRQENQWNLYLDDGIFKTYQNPNIVTKLFPSGFSAQSFILAVAGD